MRSDKLPVYAFFFMLAAFAAFFGSMFGVDSNNEWYQNLYKPSIIPPDYVFGIVWSILYVLIAIAGARIYFISKKDHKKGMTLWLSQLLVNALFSPLFFGFQSPIPQRRDCRVISSSPSTLLQPAHTWYGSRSTFAGQAPPPPVAYYSRTLAA
jgi:tryptophan-rich sensory protein